MTKTRLTAYAGLCIASIIALLFIRSWAADWEASSAGPDAIRTDGSGKVYLISADVLYLHDKDGFLVDRIPLSTFGIDRFTGDFGILKDGGLLIRREAREKPAFLKKIRRFFRQRDSAHESNGILQKCSLTTYRCEQFGSESDAFSKMTAFKIAIDEQENVYIADTRERRLLLYDRQGKVIRTANLPVAYPHSLFLTKNGMLYVTDTNLHRVVGISTEPASFGKVEDAFSILTKERVSGKIRPSALVLIDNNRWWVVNSGIGAQKGDAAVYDRKGSFVKQINLPADAEPTALTASGNDILIADRAHLRIHRVNKEGIREGEFGSLLLNVELNELGRERKVYAFYKNASLGALFAVLLSGLVIAMKARLRGKEREITHENEAAAPADAPEQLPARSYGYHDQAQIMKRGGILVAFLLISALAILVLPGEKFSAPGSLMRMFPAAAFLLFGGLFAGYVTYKKTRLEVSDDGILSVAGGKKIYSPWHQIREIKMYCFPQDYNRCILRADTGNIEIGDIEPNSAPRVSWHDLSRLFRKQPGPNRHFTALVLEIKKRAPQAEVVLVVA